LSCALAPIISQIRFRNQLARDRRGDLGSPLSGDAAAMFSAAGAQPFLNYSINSSATPVTNGAACKSYVRGDIVTEAVGSTQSCHEHAEQRDPRRPQSLVTAAFPLDASIFFPEAPRGKRALSFLVFVTLREHTESSAL
jgi:hypothetical protein